MFKSERVHVGIAMALFLSMAGGSYLLPIDLGGASLYALRGVCILAGGYYLFRNGKRSFWGDPVANAYFLLIALTLGYGALALSWSDNVMAGVKELSNIAFGYGIYFVLRNVSAGIGNKESIVPYFTWGIVALLLMAAVEIYWQIHFPSSYDTHLQDIWPGHFVHHAPAATYGNPNNFAVLLSAAVFVFVYSLTGKDNKTGTVFLVMGCFLAIWFTESRFNLLAMYLLIPFLLYTYRKSWFSFLRSRSVFVGLFVLMFMLTLLGAQFSKSNIEHVPPPVELNLPDEGAEPLESVGIRYNLMRNGLEFTTGSHYRGIGPGQFPIKMAANEGKYKTMEIVNPHFGAVELLSQYGIGVFLAWAAWWLFLFVRLLKNIRRKPVAVPLLMLIAFIPVSTANSSFLNSPTSWLYIALMLWACNDALSRPDEVTEAPEKTGTGG